MFSMLVNIVMFMVWCILVFVLLVSISGIMLVMKVNDVIRIGCSCKCVVLSMVVSGLVFLFFFVWVNFMIRIVFLVVRLISIMKLICVKMLLFFLES